MLGLLEDHRLRGAGRVRPSGPRDLPAGGDLPRARRARSSPRCVLGVDRGTAAGARPARRERELLELLGEAAAPTCSRARTTAPTADSRSRSPSRRSPAGTASPSRSRAICPRTWRCSARARPASCRRRPRREADVPGPRRLARRPGDPARRDRRSARGVRRHVRDHPRRSSATSTSRRSRGCWARRSDQGATGPRGRHVRLLGHARGREAAGRACGDCRSTGAPRRSPRLVPVSGRELEEAFDANWARFDERWVANSGQHTPADSVEFIAERLGVELDDELRAQLVDGFRQVGESVELITGRGSLRPSGRCARPGVASASCATSVSRRPRSCAARLEGLGLLGMFDAWSFSDETGWFKPAAEAFEPALGGLGVERSRERRPRRRQSPDRRCGGTGARHAGRALHGLPRSLRPIGARGRSCHRRPSEAAEACSAWHDRSRRFTPPWLALRRSRDDANGETEMMRPIEDDAWVRRMAERSHRARSERVRRLREAVAARPGRRLERAGRAPRKR